MKYLIISFIMLSAFPTCCNEDSVEVERILLSKEEDNLINYTKDEVVKFKHSNGFIFDVLVTNNDYSFRRSFDEYCDECCGGEYRSLQERFVSLTSNYPNLTMTLSLSNNNFSYSEYKSINFSLNSYSTNLFYDDKNEFICDSLVVCHDQIKINNTNYFNVLEKKLDSRFHVNDTIDFYPQKLFYNTTKGIIQIKMSNNESYFIDN